MAPTNMAWFFFQAEDGIRDIGVTGVQTCALPIFPVTLARATDDPRLSARCTARWAPRGSRSRRRRSPARCAAGGDRKSVVEGKSVDLGGRRIIKKHTDEREPPVKMSADISHIQLH